MIVTVRATGYFRTTCADEPPGASVTDGHRERLEEYARLHLPGVEWLGTFSDPASRRKKAFGQRPGAVMAQRHLERGDHLVILNAGLAFKGWRDLLGALRLWEARGIVAHFLEPAVSLATAEGRAALAVLEGFWDAEGDRRAEGALEAHARRKGAGKPVNQHVGHGFRLVGPRGRRRRIKDTYTREVGKLVVRWRLAGCTWEGIVLHLLRH